MSSTPQPSAEDPSALKEAFKGGKETCSCCKSNLASLHLADLQMECHSSGQRRTPEYPSTTKEADGSAHSLHAPRGSMISKE